MRICIFKTENDMDENGIKELLSNVDCVTWECKRAKSEVSKLVNSLIVAYLIITKTIFCHL